MTTFTRPRRNERGDDGFTLIEVLVAAAIFVALTGFITMVTISMMRASTKTVNSSEAQTLLLDAASRITRDVSYATNINYADPNTLHLETLRDNTCVRTVWTANPDASTLTSTVYTYSTSGCPEGQGTPSTTETKTVVQPFATPGSGVFTYFSVRNGVLNTPVDPTKDIRRVGFLLQTTTSDRDKPLSVKSSAIPFVGGAPKTVDPVTIQVPRPATLSGDIVPDNRPNPPQGYDPQRHPQLTWTNPTPGFTNGYILFRYADTDLNNSNEQTQLFDTADPNQMSYDDTTLPEGACATYQVYVQTPKGLSAASNAVNLCETPLQVSDVTCSVDINNLTLNMTVPANGIRDKNTTQLEVTVRRAGNAAWNWTNGTVTWNYTPANDGTHVTYTASVPSIRPGDTYTVTAAPLNNTGGNHPKMQYGPSRDSVGCYVDMPIAAPTGTAVSNYIVDWSWGQPNANWEYYNDGTYEYRSWFADAPPGGAIVDPGAGGPYDTHGVQPVPHTRRTDTENGSLGAGFRNWSHQLWVQACNLETSRCSDRVPGVVPGPGPGTVTRDDPPWAPRISLTGRERDVFGAPEQCFTWGTETIRHCGKMRSYVYDDMTYDGRQIDADSYEIARVLGVGGEEAYDMSGGRHNISRTAITTPIDVVAPRYTGGALRTVLLSNFQGAHLLPGRNYMFAIRAINEFGAGPWRIASDWTYPEAQVIDADSISHGENALASRWNLSNQGVPIGDTSRPAIYDQVKPGTSTGMDDWIGTGIYRTSINRADTLDGDGRGGDVPGRAGTPDTGSSWDRARPVDGRVDYGRLIRRNGGADPSTAITVANLGQAAFTTDKSAVGDGGWNFIHDIGLPSITQYGYAIETCIGDAVTAAPMEYCTRGQDVNQSPTYQNTWGGTWTTIKKPDLELSNVDTAADDTTSHAVHIKVTGVTDGNGNASSWYKVTRTFLGRDNSGNVWRLQDPNNGYHVLDVPMVDVYESRGNWDAYSAYGGRTHHEFNINSADRPWPANVTNGSVLRVRVGAVQERSQDYQPFNPSSVYSWVSVISNEQTLTVNNQ